MQTHENTERLLAPRRRPWSKPPSQNLLYGKEKPHERLTVTLIAVRQALSIPKAVLTNQRKKTGKTVEEMIWFLAPIRP